MALSSSFSLTTTAELRGQYPPGLAQNQASQGSSNFVDGSSSIFSIYLEIATEEDQKMAERWKADADGILIFVRPYCIPNFELLSRQLINSFVLDRFILCCRRIVDSSVHSRHSPESARHLHFYVANIYQATIIPILSKVRCLC